MIDFTVTAITRDGILFCTVFYLLILAVFWKKGTSCKYVATTGNLCWFFLSVLVFVLMSWTNGDWFHYQGMMQLGMYGGMRTGMEEFYEDVIQYVNGNYLLFRTIVWGSALVLLCLAFRVLEIEVTTALFLVFAVFVNYFDYSRSALAIAVYFFGLGVMLRGSNWIYKACGVLIICYASYFHRSATLLSLLTVLCILPINKRTLLPILILLIVGFSSVKGLVLSSLEEVALSGEDGLAEKTSFYLNQNRSDREMVTGSAVGMIIGYWKYTVFYLYFAAVTYFMFKGRNYKTVPFSIKAVYKVLFGLMIFAVLMYFFNVGHLALYYRFLMMTYVPITIVIVYLYRSRLIPRRFYMGLLYFGAGYVAFEFLYRSAIGA